MLRNAAHRINVHGVRRLKRCTTRARGLPTARRKQLGSAFSFERPESTQHPEARVHVEGSCVRAHIRAGESPARKARRSCRAHVYPGCSPCSGWRVCAPLIAPLTPQFALLVRTGRRRAIRFGARGLDMAQPDRNHRSNPSVTSSPLPAQLLEALHAISTPSASTRSAGTCGVRSADDGTCEALCAGDLLAPRTPQPPAPPERRAGDAASPHEPAEEADASPLSPAHCGGLATPCKSTDTAGSEQSVVSVDALAKLARLSPASLPDASRLEAYALVRCCVQHARALAFSQLAWRRRLPGSWSALHMASRDTAGIIPRTLPARPARPRARPP